MKTTGKDILSQFLKRWKGLLFLEALVLGIGVGIFIYVLTTNYVYSIIGCISTVLGAALYIKPWKPDLDTTTSYLDTHLETLEYSTGLFLKNQESLSGIAQLQQAKIEDELRVVIKNINPPTHILKVIVISILLVGFGFLGREFNILERLQPHQSQLPEAQQIPFVPTDSIEVKKVIPSILDQRVIMKYPDYTKVATQSSTVMDIKVVEGTQVTWMLKFDRAIKSVVMKSTENEYTMTLDGDSYTRTQFIRNSGFYSFKFEAKDGTTYISDLYAIEAVQDSDPSIDINGLEQLSSFTYDEEKLVRFNTEIQDDYGISKAHIIATVSKGSGESVKFREEQLFFDTPLVAGNKDVELAKTIDLDQLDLEPGDELYFYVEAIDYKTPTPNVARSETYFATIKDTTSYEFGVEGTLGVDRLVDYFRSQRQLIIDTEKLIKNRSVLETKEFKFQSNELGFDQKSLRLKYGAFMGEESEEIAIAPEGADIDEGIEEDHDDHDDHDDDPLEEYTHDHDGDNEHNLVETEASKNKNEASKNPLQEFMHDHGDPESATLFEESLKVKLLKALSEMWDAELYLRLYKPEKSLPYQYKALKYIQEIKNSARIYVHRIGFDPPPIKEDKRLTGELDAISSYQKSDIIADEVVMPFIKQTIGRLENILTSDTEITSFDRILFEKAGTELAQQAIAQPGKFLNTLQLLQRLIEGKNTSRKLLFDIHKGLLDALPKPVIKPYKSTSHLDEINQLLLKELKLDD